MTLSSTCTVFNLSTGGHYPAEGGKLVIDVGRASDHDDVTQCGYT